MSLNLIIDCNLVVTKNTKVSGLLQTKDINNVEDTLLDLNDKLNVLNSSLTNTQSQNLVSNDLLSQYPDLSNLAANVTSLKSSNSFISNVLANVLSVSQLSTNALPIANSLTSNVQALQSSNSTISNFLSQYNNITSDYNSLANNNIDSPYNKSGIYLNTSNISLGSNLITYPTTALITNSQDGYEVSASSNYSGTLGPYKAFDKNSIQYGSWQSAARYNGNGTYNNNVSTSYRISYNSTNSKTGEWIQIKLPYSIVLTNYTLYSSPSNYAPKSWVLLGSIDVSTWIALDLQSNITNWSTSNPQTFQPNQTQTYALYTYYRFVFTDSNGASSIYIDNINLYSTVSVLGTDLVEYPNIPLGLGNFDNKFGYSLDSSSNYNQTVSQYNNYTGPIKAFDKGLNSSVNYWRSGTRYNSDGTYGSGTTTTYYVDNTNTGTNLDGEWISITTPNYINVTSYTIQSSGNRPKSFYLLGNQSIDPNDPRYILINSSSNVTQWDSDTNSYTFTNSNYYREYKLVITNTNNSNSVRIDELKLYSKTQPQTLPSYNLTTNGNIVVNNSNVSIFTNTSNVKILANSLYLPGKNSNLIVNLNNTPTTSNWTVEFWVKPSVNNINIFRALNKNGNVVLQANITPNSNLNVTTPSSPIGIIPPFLNNFNSSRPLILNQWNFIVFRANSTANAFYVNGQSLYGNTNTTVGKDFPQSLIFGDFSNTAYTPSANIYISGLRVSAYNDIYKNLSDINSANTSARGLLDNNDYYVDIENDPNTFYINYFRGSDNSTNFKTSESYLLNVFKINNFSNPSETPTTSATVNNNGIIMRAASDERLKSNVKPITNATSFISNITPVTFNWKNDDSYDVGFIAQDVQKYNSNLIYTTPSGYLGFDQVKLVSYITKSLQELDEKISILEQ